MFLDVPELSLTASKLLTFPDVPELVTLTVSKSLTMFPNIPELASLTISKLLQCSLVFQSCRTRRPGVPRRRRAWRARARGRRPWGCRGETKKEARESWTTLTQRRKGSSAATAPHLRRSNWRNWRKHFPGRIIPMCSPGEG